jgi:hypothetical protein
VAFFLFSNSFILPLYAFKNLIWGEEHCGADTVIGCINKEKFMVSKIFRSVALKES